MSSLLTARDLADRLGVSTETVLRWVRRGALPAIRLPGGAIRFREGDLNTWLETRATPWQGVLPTKPGAAHLATLPSAALPTNDGKE